MEKLDCVIVCTSDESPRFWTGSRWSHEYPDAIMYTDGKPAWRELDRLVVRFEGIKLIKDYGTTDERVIR